MTAVSPTRPGYRGLPRPEPTLPSIDYYGPEAFQRDLERIWSRSWVYVCRADELAEPLSFRTFRLGSQTVLIVRDEKGDLQAFHNTCRHRGSALCVGSGRLKGRLITCPYHAWSYSLRGELVRAPSKVLPEGFEKADYPLYRVAISDWRGFVFVNLEEEEPAGDVASTFDPESGDLSNWPLERLVRGHRMVRLMRCNWKVFWENFNECLHCPGVHKHLSQLVPIYGRGLMTRQDDPDWEAHAEDDSPAFSGTLRTGAETWSRDGKAHGPKFPGLSEAEKAAGQTYATHLPSMFVVGHVDYVRVVSLRPVGAEETELTAEWLFDPEAMASPGFDLDNIVSFGAEVLEEDAAICELNQRGLRSRRHECGVLMPEEYEIKRFHDWVRAARA